VPLTLNYAKHHESILYFLYIVLTYDKACFINSYTMANQGLTHSVMPP